MAIKLFKKPTTIDIVTFGGGVSSGNSSMKDLLGGKGANLCELTNMGIPVPPGFIIPTTYCLQPKNTAFKDGMAVAIKNGLGFIKEQLGHDNFLVSVRSGARVSMPGMMDTILNVGLCSDKLSTHLEMFGEGTYKDLLHRFLFMYGTIVVGIPEEEFKSVSPHDYIHVLGKHCDHDMDMQNLVLRSALAVFESWNTPRAIEYRKINNIPDDWGTAVVIQAMVFGNLNGKSATGVLFTRDPSTGERKVTGEYLPDAQGEDVVAGLVTPYPLSSFNEWSAVANAQLLSTALKLESHYKDMQDIEFTVENYTLWVLQTRSGKRTAKAEVRIASDMYKEGLIDLEELRKRLTKDTIIAAMTDTISGESPEPHATGIAAGGGVVVGRVALSNEFAINCTDPTILVREETTPDDIVGMNASVGILTKTGGLTSHAAVVARGMNKTCVVGVGGELHVGAKYIAMGTETAVEGDYITIDGSTGRMWIGALEVLKGGVSRGIFEAICSAKGVQHSVYLMPDINQSKESMREELSAYTGTVTIGLGVAIHQECNGWVRNLLEVAYELNTSITFDLDCSSDDDEYMRLITPHSREAIIEDILGLISTEMSVVSTTYQWSVSVINVPSGVKVPQLINCGEIKTVKDIFDSWGSVIVTNKVIKEVFGNNDTLNTVLEMVNENKKHPVTLIEPSQFHWCEYL